MAKKSASNDTCCSGESFHYKIESLTSVDERGQMVLPKELREKAGIKPGDKLAIVSMEKEGKVCCLSLIRADELSSMVKDFLGPMIGTITNG